jgi:hypothetical protein
MTEPDENHPAPPFARQAQPWSGLDARMQAPPDHAESRRSARVAGGELHHRQRVGSAGGGQPGP